MHLAEYGDRFVQCPFFLGNNNEKQRKKNHIRCEGVEKGCTISLVFASDKKKKEYKELYCCSTYGMHKCHIYNMLNRKYGVKDG